MIQVDDLALSYQGVSLFEAVSFTVNTGERCGLLGRNGSGKTSLFRLLVGEEKADRGTLRMPKGYRLGYLDQHIRFASSTVLEEAAGALREEERGNLHQAKKMLSGLGITEQEWTKNPGLLSGGYQLRLHLAKVLLSRPDCLLLDEPTNYLDILSVRFLSRFLRKFPGELILISHDRSFMDSVTTHTLGLHRGRIRKCEGGTQRLFEILSQEEHVYEKTRQNQEKKRAHLQAFIDRFGAKATKASQAQSKQKQLERIPELEELKALHHLDLQFHSSPFYGEKMLQMQQLSFSYTPDSSLIRSFSFSIEKGQRIAMMGKNGRGKSTLLRLIVGELTPQEGSLKVAERAQIGYFGQTHLQRLCPESTVEEEIARVNPTLTMTEVKAICGQMLLGGDAAKKKISVLSGGEKSRVLLGQILARPCNLLLLDEPTHHLDVESIEALMDAIEAFDGAVLMVTHSEWVAHRLQTDQLIICDSGGMTSFEGTYTDFLERKGWDEEEDLLAPKPEESQRKNYEELLFVRAQLRQLEKKQTGICQHLEALEKQQKQRQEELSQLSQEGDLLRLTEMAHLLARQDKEIEDCYASFLRLEEEMTPLRERRETLRSSSRVKEEEMDQ